jgi:hypothetical protein
LSFHGDISFYIQPIIVSFAVSLPCQNEPHDIFKAMEILGLKNMPLVEGNREILISAIFGSIMAEYEGNPLYAWIY